MPSEAELVAQFGVSRMTVNRALRELQAEGLVDARAGRGHLRRAAAPRVVHAHDPRPARGDRRARPRHHAARARWRARSRAGAALAARLGLARRRAGVPHADRALRERRAAAVRGPLRQPGLRARLPGGRLHAAPRRRTTCSRWRRCGRRSTRSRPARRRAQEARLLRHRARRALPGRRAPHRAAAARRSRSRGWCTRARATSSKAQFAAMRPDLRSRSPTVPPAALAQRRRRHARAAAPGRQPHDWRCASASPTSTPTARSRPSRRRALVRGDRGRRRGAALPTATRGDARAATRRCASTARARAELPAGRRRRRATST